MVNNENRSFSNNEKITTELSYIVKYLYENFEMLSRWTPEFTAKELLLILELRDNKSLRIGDIVDKTGFSFSTVSWLVDNLVKKKVLSRRRDSNDRRVVRVKLAAKGQETIQEYERIFEEIADLFYAVLTPEEQQEFLRLSCKVIDKLEEKTAGRLVNPQVKRICK